MMKTKLTFFVTVLVAALFGVGCASSSLNKGLVAHYPFNGNAMDESGNGNHGEVKGATLAIDRHGVKNGAYSFDGRDDGVSLPSHLFHKLEAFTFATWLNLDALTHLEAILSLAQKNSDNELLIQLLPDSIQVTISREDKFSASVPTASFVHRWRQIVVARESSSPTIKVYVDGVLKINLVYTKFGPLIVDPGGAWLGQDQDSVGGRFETTQALNGSLDDVRIYNRALSAEEVQALYDLEKPKVQ